MAEAGVVEEPAAEIEDSPASSQHSKHRDHHGIDTDLAASTQWW